MMNDKGGLFGSGKHFQYKVFKNKNKNPAFNTIQITLLNG